MVLSEVAGLLSILEADSIDGIDIVLHLYSLASDQTKEGFEGAFFVRQ